MKPKETEEPEDKSLDLLLSIGSATSTLKPKEAAELFGHTKWEICGLPVRLLTLADLLIHTRMENSYAVGQKGETAPSFAQRLFDACAVWFVAQCRSSRDVMTLAENPDAFRVAVESFMAEKTADVDLSALIESVLSYLSEGGRTRVSASSPPLPSGVRSTPGND